MPAPSNGHSAVDGYTGLYVPIEIQFPDAWVADNHCDCQGGGTLPQCGALCEHLNFELGQYAGGHCDSVDLRTRLNRVRLFLGLSPTNGREASGLDVNWTAKLFPGAKNFHLEHMFLVNPVVAGMPYTRESGDGGFAAVTDDIDHDVGIAANVHNCNAMGDCACTEGDCDRQVANGVSDELSGQLQRGFEDAVQGRVVPLLSYTDSHGYFNQPAPGPCNMEDASCSEWIEDVFLPASATYQ